MSVVKQKRPSHLFHRNACGQEEGHQWGGFVGLGSPVPVGMVPMRKFLVAVGEAANVIQLCHLMEYRFMGR